MSTAPLFPIGFQPDQHTILVVDDNPNNLGVVFDYLKGYGFNLLAARDGESGLKRVHYAKPDLILLDVMMPGLDGFEVCRRLKQDPATADIPVIFMTALASVDDTVQGFAAGAVDYITKPLRQEEMLARITTHLRLRALSRDLQVHNDHLQRMSNELLTAKDLAEKQAATLAELNASKDRLFSIVAHDLRGPFTALLLTSQTVERLAGSVPPERLRKMGHNLHESAKAVANLLENLLEWSRLQLGRIRPNPEMLATREVVARSISVFREMAEQKNVSVENEIPADLHLFADDTMLALVVRNLVSNALKFTPSNGQVRVAVRALQPENNQVQLVVTDTGVGIAAEDQAKLFKLGVHHSALGTNQERGSGLGLLLCQEMLALNDGEIWIESVPGTGTQVYFSLPLRPPAKETQTAA